MLKKAMLPFLLFGTSLLSNAQTDTIAVLSTKNDTIIVSSKQDTLQIGSMLIVKKNVEAPKHFKTIIKIGDASYGRPDGGELGWFKGDFKKTKIEIGKTPKQLKNVQTNLWTFDLGFANFHDKSPAIYWLIDPLPNNLSIYPGPVYSKSFSLNNKKSTNVNIWAVQQKVNIYKHKINLKYGIGIEMFNFTFEKPISFREDIPGYVKYDNVLFTKNKLLVKYLTIPVQINFKPNPNLKKGFYASVGMSAGYLLNAKNKQISAERGKEKFEGNFNLNDWRIATIGELGVGSIRLYGSYGMSNLFNKSQSFYDMQPFALGLRFSKF